MKIDDVDENYDDDYDVELMDPHCVAREIT